jgi:DNA modification methylase
MATCSLLYPLIFKFVMEAFTDPGEIVFEPFRGSGTSILAAEQCGCKARASELAPEYVDVALKRWMQHHPGREPVLVGSGQTWSEVVAAREPEALRAAA